MTDDITIAVSSRTSNTQKIADAVCAQLDELRVGYRVREAGEPVEGQNVIICFWCFKSRFDVRNKNLLAELSGKKILVFGTFGGYPDSAYADKVRRNVIGDVSEHNECLGVLLSQGRVSMKNVEKRRQLPADGPHHLDDAGCGAWKSRRSIPTGRTLHAPAASCANTSGASPRSVQTRGRRLLVVAAAFAAGLVRGDDVRQRAFQPLLDDTVGIAVDGGVQLDARLLESVCCGRADSAAYHAGDIAVFESCHARVVAVPEALDDLGRGDGVVFDGVELEFLRVAEALVDTALAVIGDGDNFHRRSLSCDRRHVGFAV